MLHEGVVGCMGWDKSMSYAISRKNIYIYIYIYIYIFTYMWILSVKSSIINIPPREIQMISI